MVDIQHVLLGLLHDQANNDAKDVLEFNNMTYEDALASLQRMAQPTKDGIGLPDEDEEEEADNMMAGAGRGSSSHHAGTATQTQRGGGKTPVLDNFSHDLTQAAREGK